VNHDRELDIIHVELWHLKNSFETKQDSTHSIENGVIAGVTREMVDIQGQDNT
jgi:hypothetical protein